MSFPNKRIAENIGGLMWKLVFIMALISSINIFAQNIDTPDNAQGKGEVFAPHSIDKTIEEFGLGKIEKIKLAEINLKLSVASGLSNKGRRCYFV